jgi:hypothetical protein
VFSGCLLLLGCGREMALDWTGRKTCWQCCHICREELWIITLGICQQTIRHFQDTVYWAMLPSDRNLSANYQSLSGHCLLSDAIKRLQFVSKQSVTFRTLFTERCHQVTAFCQQTIRHFQDTVYWAMPSSGCHSCLPFRSSRHSVWARVRPFCLKFVVIYFSTCSKIFFYCS